MINSISTAGSPKISFIKSRNDNVLFRIKQGLENIFFSKIKKKGDYEQENHMITEESVHIKRLKLMYLANILISGPIGLSNLIAPKTMQKMTGMPTGDPISYGIASGAIPLSFGLAGFLGLRSPVKLAPVLGLQVIYKSLFLFGSVFPLAMKKKVPAYAAPLIGIYILFLAGNLIAKPFPYILSRASKK